MKFSIRCHPMSYPIQSCYLMQKQYQQMRYAGESLLIFDCSGKQR